MHKCLAWFLIVLTAAGFNSQVTYASTDHVSTKVSQLKAQIENLPPDTMIAVKLRDRSEIEGRLVASAGESFELATPRTITVSYSEVKSVREDPSGQVSPGSAQNPAPHQSHFARNALIGVGVMCVVAVIFALAAKK